MQTATTERGALHRVTLVKTAGVIRKARNEKKGRGRGENAPEFRRATATRMESKGETNVPGETPPPPPPLHPARLMARMRLKRTEAWALLRLILTSAYELDPNGVFLLGISFFVLEILAFWCYAN